MKKYLLVIAGVLILASLINILSITGVLPAGKNAPKNSEAAHLIVKVTDAADGMPLAGATVVIPERSGKFTTKSDGKTETIEVPVRVNDNYDDINAREYGEVTVLVYKDGYVDFIIFYIKVEAGKTRNITLPIYPGEGLHHLIESPDESWVKEIVDKYKK